MAITVKSDLNFGLDSKITNLVSANKVAITAPATGATLTIEDGVTLTASANADVSGTNSGDQTSIVGITGTKADFNTALTGTDFVCADDLGANVGTFLATPSSANLAAAVTGATGTGALVFANTPTLVTPDVGAATATSINGNTITAGTGTLTLGTFTASLGGNLTTAAGLTTSGANSLTLTTTAATNVTLPTTGTLATQTYVDDAVTVGVHWELPVVAMSTGNVDISTELEDGDVLDGVTLNTGDRVLLKDQSAPAENGPYTVVASGNGVRTLDWDGTPANEASSGDTWRSLGGTINNGRAYGVNNTGLITVGVTALTFGLVSNAIDYISDGSTISISGATISLSSMDSATLAGKITDETGSGALVFGTSPTITSATLVTPALGTPASGIMTNVSGTASGLTAGLVTSIGDLTGDVTSTNRATALDNTAITGKSAVTLVGTDYILISDTSDSGNLKKALLSDIIAASANRFSATFGDTSATNFVIAHGLATANLIPTVRKVSTGAIIMVDTIIDSTNVTLDFNTAPGNNEYTVTLVG